jgi:hypothetical protein
MSGKVTNFWFAVIHIGDFNYLELRNTPKKRWSAEIALCNAKPGSEADLHYLARQSSHSMGKYLKKRNFVIQGD